MAGKRKNNDKMAECFTPHVMMHSLFGLGLGITLVSLVPSFNNFWVGVVVMGIAFGLDAMRK